MSEQKQQRMEDIPKDLPKDDEVHQATFFALVHWYTKVFKMWGWVVLAYNHGKMDKVKCFQDSLNHLIKAIDNKINSTPKLPEFKIAELKIMKEDIICLQDHANDDFSRPPKKHHKTQSGGRRRSRRAASRKSSKKGSRKGSRKASAKGRK